MLITIPDTTPSFSAFNALKEGIMAASTVEPVLMAHELTEKLREIGFRVSAKTIYDWGSRGRIPSAKVAGRRYYRLSLVLAALEEAMRGKKPEE